MTLFGEATTQTNYRYSSSTWKNSCQVKEDNKKYLKILDAKYRLIPDHEICMRKYVLIRTNLLRLQKEFREEKMASRRSIAVEENLFRNLGRELPTIEYDNFEPLVPCGTSSSDHEEYESPPKKFKLFHDFDKENEMECDSSKVEPLQVADDASILRDSCEVHSSEVNNRQSSNVLNDNSYNINYSVSCSNNNNNNSSEMDWNRQSCQVKCGSPFIINDYRGIASRSLLMPIES